MIASARAHGGETAPGARPLLSRKDGRRGAGSRCPDGHPQGPLRNRGRTTYIRSRVMCALPKHSRTNILGPFLVGIWMVQKRELVVQYKTKIKLQCIDGCYFGCRLRHARSICRVLASGSFLLRGCGHLAQCFLRIREPR